VLICAESRAGHGSGEPASMIIEESADVYAFFAENLALAK
jgi:prolyl oligopeptidase PreP (S9A serine peptidase family)